MAGSDLSGGAGVQADPRASAALGLFRSADVTALAAQCSEGARCPVARAAAAVPQRGGGRFREVAERSGPGLQARLLGRGIAWGDIDGDPDFLVANNGGTPLLPRNDGGNRNHWLAIRAAGRKSNRDGIGTNVVVTTGSTRQQGWIRSGSSFCSAGDLKALFGLGGAAQADSVEL